jgi:hypothetical protein
VKANPKYVKKIRLAKAARRVESLVAPAPAPKKSFARKVLNAQNCDPTKQLNVHEICLRVVSLAQAMRERQFYPYQVELAYRIVESLLLHDSEVITSLMARQIGKTETLGGVVGAIAVALPWLAKLYPDDWHLNITDDKGVYRGYAFGVAIGIYAPRLDQSQIMFERVKSTLETDTSKKIFKEMNVSLEENNGNTIRLSSGSRILCESASEQSKIEGETHQLLIAEEAQDISDLKMKKSLHPMVSATGGTIVKIGTATIQKCDFYTAIRNNERMFLMTGKRNHFFYPYTVGIRYNSLYRKTVEREKLHLGEDSDEFRCSYKGEWIFERGMFVTSEQLFNRKVAQATGVWASRYPQGIKHLLPHYSIVAGIDWGASYDSTVVTLMAVDWNNPLEQGQGYTPEGSYDYTHYQKHIIDWVEFVGDNYELQFGNIVQYLLSVNKLRKVVTDSNTCGLPLYHRLVSVFGKTDIEISDFNFHAKLKSDGYKALYADICGKRLTFPAGNGYRDHKYQKFVNQMLDLRKSYKNGLMCVAHPEEKGAHDDFSDSAMLAAWGANTASKWGQFEFSDHNPFFH